jgi:cysteine synthase A
MSKIYKSVSELIGNTPLLELRNYDKKEKALAKIIAKVESFNPCSSIKDRIGYALIKDAEDKGLINKDTTLIEPTSGNTGVGLASVAASKGYKLILTMPETMSIERRKLLAAFGANIVLTEGSKGMNGAVSKANELHNEIKNSIIMGQFTNPANPEAHKNTTAKEILKDTKGKIDFFVAGVGTGGTLTGIGEVLKEYNPNIKVIAVEPFDSPLLSKGYSGSHGLMGIGANFIPIILNTKIIDEIITVKTEEAYSAARKIATMEGLLVGISSGAALYAATELAKRPENKNKRIIVILPDSGERYLSTPLFDYKE